MIFAELQSLGRRGIELRNLIEKGSPSEIVALQAEYEELHQIMDEAIARLHDLYPHMFWRDDDPQYIEMVMQWRRERILRKQNGHKRARANEL